MIKELVEKIIIERNKVIEDVIWLEIQEIVKENEVETKIVINEKAVVNALNKQMPKKPIPHKVKADKILIKNGYWGKGTTVYKCPNCGEYITRLYKHCSDCGQAIDWSDTYRNYD